MFSARGLVKSKPTQSLLSRQARRNFKRYVCLKIISRVIKRNIRIDQRCGTVIRRVEDVQIAVAVSLQQHSNAIAFAKDVLRIDANCQSIRVTQEQRHSESHTTRVDWRRWIGWPGRLLA